MCTNGSIPAFPSTYQIYSILMSSLYKQSIDTWNLMFSLKHDPFHILVSNTIELSQLTKTEMNSMLFYVSSASSSHL